MNSISSGFNSALTGIYKGMNAIKQDAQVIASTGTEKSLMDKDVTTAIVDMNSSMHQVEASTKSLVAQDKMLGALLDVMA